VECHRIEKKQQRNAMDVCTYSPLIIKTKPGNDVTILDATRYGFGLVS
jgi:hypothetical protein